MNDKANIRLYIEESLSQGMSITFDKDQSHYLANVMRSKLGSEIAIFNGQDGEWIGEITDIQKRAVTLQLNERRREQATEPDVWLVFAPIKKARIDFIAQKATELGASLLLPIYTRRTIVDRVKTDRLHANAVEAAEQCERLTVPTIGEPVKFEKLMADWPADRRIMFCDETLSGKPAHTALSNFTKVPKEPWAIFIGPEGGFDDSERSFLHNHKNAVPVSLGPRIMRADTAAMAALSLWQSALGDW
ncbi:16S rRNA (uracil(1498)-N(3))-methyltransferase [Kordiimonas aquimaris]|uniref:16S rRNA (uracil(1498)-N(3))-methyltransferase n=1 Tax=Kordiimonas aquimaris TaxID=707591 RepID=UPI0021D35177|nr:16S rRNA (uracil(1498)-N(3))-methyltransferase [Kordiimonas aquimaris]